MVACIAAASQGVPTVCLAYSPKFSGVMKPLDAGVRVVDLRSAGATDVMEACKQVLRNREKLRSALLSAITPVCGSIRGRIAELPGPES